VLRARNGRSADADLLSHLTPGQATPAALGSMVAYKAHGLKRSRIPDWR
jgi:hypothetical protein